MIFEGGGMRATERSVHASAGGREGIPMVEVKKTNLLLCMTAGVFALFSLSSCAYDNDMTYLNDQVTALNKRVKSLEEGRGRDVEGVRSGQVGLRSDIDQMQGEIRRISGRTEENERLIKRSFEKDLGDQDATKTKVKELSDRVAELEKKVKGQQETPGTESPVVQERKGQEEVASKPAEPGVTAPGAIKNKEVELYEKALRSFREGKYEESIDGFKSFVKTYPKSDRADNAYFWIGDSYMALKQYEQAILSFQDVVKKYPKGNKVPNALLKQAQAFLEIKDKTSAEVLFKKVVKSYPGTSEATIAQKKLDSLK
jgi:tol-pal system protein YbgF